jgi:hypothetical protein
MGGSLARLGLGVKARRRGAKDTKKAKGSASFLKKRSKKLFFLGAAQG